MQLSFTLFLVLITSKIMQNKNATFDAVNEVLEACIMAYPVSAFIISLYKQYQTRGSLSKKQLEGLHSKASQIEGLAPGKLATLEAIIKKMPNRFKSDKPEPKKEIEKDDKLEKLMDEILLKYPQHKRVLFLKSKFENNDPFTSADLADLKRFEETLRRQSQ